MRKVLPSVVRFDSGKKVDLGGGSISNLILTDSTISGNECMMGYSVFKPGIKTSQKVHKSADEYAYVVSGSGKLTVEKELIPYSAGDSLYIPSGVPHGITNDGAEDIVMVFFFTSPNYPKTSDAP